MVVAKTNFAHAALAKQLIPQLVQNEGGLGKSELHDNPVAKIFQRTYLAIVFGRPESTHGIVKTKIARHRVNRQQMCNLDINSEARWAKIAVTEYFVEKTWAFPGGKSLGLMRFQLFTGRTHQVRLHCQYLKTPIIGDQTYGKRLPRKEAALFPQVVADFPRQALHACSIRFVHPVTREVLSFYADPPQDMRALMEACDAHKIICAL
jgi:23S rRNA pseudouridine1911/1915/1917 synthase